jgi:hypothetical protein
MSDIVPVEQGMNLSKIGQWALDAQQAHQVATALAKTSFVPKVFQGKPGEVTAAILAGAELGIEPMAALRSINVIQGTPAMSANALRALVQANGHEVWIKESSATRVVACAKRKGSEIEHRSVWTIDRAKQLGLTSKDNWQKQPEAMLIARATSEVCRLVAADAILGMAYSIEELQDQGEEAKPRRTARKATVPVAVEAPDLEPPAIEAAEPVVDVVPEPEVTNE